MYILSGLLFFFRGGVDALLIRTQLIAPNTEFWVFQGDKYNGLFTTHGTIMIFFVAMPILIGLMNVVVPLQIGAKDLAFPILNSLSFWLFFSGAILFNLSFFFGTPPNAGWTAYAPLSISQFTPDVGNSFYIFSIQLSGIGTLLTAINMIVTILRLRAPGMKMFRMPLFTWSTFVTSVLILIAFSTLSVALYLLMFDRMFGTSFFLLVQKVILFIGSIYSGYLGIQKYTFWHYLHLVSSRMLSQLFRKRLFLDIHPWCYPLF